MDFLTVDKPTILLMQVDMHIEFVILIPSIKRYLSFDSDPKWIGKQLDTSCMPNITESIHDIHDYMAIFCPRYISAWPTQTESNGTDCGVYVLYYIKYLLEI